jgi:hypothetical protein
MLPANDRRKRLMISHIWLSFCRNLAKPVAKLFIRVSPRKWQFPETETRVGDVG